MPLYACDRCGFTSAAFRADAAAAHRLEYPDCDGVIRIVFRSDDRYRSRPPARASAGPREAARDRKQDQAHYRKSRQPFAVREHLDRDQKLCLTLVGDLDVASVETLGERLAELKAAGRPIRLDLSQLAFIDSSGVQALLVALSDARWTGWPVEVAPELSLSVERAVRVVGIAQVLWPQDPGASRWDATAARQSGTTGPDRRF